MNIDFKIYKEPKARKKMSILNNTETDITTKLIKVPIIFVPKTTTNNKIEPHLSIKGAKLANAFGKKYSTI
jgi:hypothetical protein